MTIIRNGQEIKLTADEVYLAHKQFITDWMASTLQTDFGFSMENSYEYAYRAYDIYCEGDGLTEYEAVQKAAEEYEKKKQDELKNPRNIIAAYSYEHNDGDQNWKDETKYYKLSDGTFRKEYYEGYYGKTNISAITYDEIVETMTRIEREVQRKQEAIEMYGNSVFTRGGYTINISLFPEA